ncbi:hypothetical protein B1810_11315 [Panacagrimonas perspica]|uniref:DUF6980 family protein n=1 Tax=Panacagrimonas perspica TaxID=381431 RepID=UPI00105E5A81|nr:hypothetical protein [Panacagrimonas perspica]THD03159.1 hypothetical protein B1810_11315 [Panacagrimonas perspica]
MSEQCCAAMSDAIADPQNPVVYIPKFREFGLRILDGGTSTSEIAYCPWCGARLPTSLRDAWFDELEKLGIDISSDVDVPARYRGADWYQQK